MQNAGFNEWLRWPFFLPQSMLSGGMYKNIQKLSQSVAGKSVMVQQFAVNFTTEFFH